MKKRKRRKASKGRNSRQNKITRQNRPDSTYTGAQSQYWWPGGGPTINLVWFYVPLRIPLNLPDWFILPIGAPYHIHYPNQELTELIGLTGPPESPFGISTSIRVHQIEGSANTPEVEASIAASQRQPGVDRPDINPLNAPITTTVLECVTSLGNMGLEEIEEALAVAFEKILIEINNLLRNYAILTQNRIVLVQKETLPWAILAGWRLDCDYESDPGPEEQCLYLVNAFDSLVMAMSASPAEEMSEEEIVEMLDRQDALNDPRMADIHNMLLDARLALQRGEYAVSVVLLASGCELYLRLLLEVLLWEDGVSPRDAVGELFESNDIGHSISYILKSKFHNKLGGIWDITSTSNAVGCFYKAVFERRNIYLHTGIPITESDADAASEAATAFLEFVYTQLTAKLSSYPFAAALMIGEPVVTQKGIRDKIDTALRTKESELPLSPLMYDCWSHFDGYRKEVKVYQDPEIQRGAPLMGEINEQTHVALLIYPNGGIEYWLIDPDRSVACRAEKPKMPAEQAKSVRSLEKQARRHPSNGLNACRLFDVSPIPLESPPTWVSAHEVWRMEHRQGGQDSS